MALTASELEQTREILQLSTTEYGELEQRANAMSAARETRMKADLALWTELGLDDDTDRIKGGRDGDDVDPERTRTLLYNRIARRLDYPPRSGEASDDGNAMRLIRVSTPLWSATEVTEDGAD